MDPDRRPSAMQVVRTGRARTAEQRVLAGLSERMMAPEAAGEAMRAYAEETNRLNRARRANRDRWRSELVKIEKAIAAVISAIEEGMYHPSMKSRMADLEREKSELNERLAKAQGPSMPDIHPSVATIYRKKIERLAEALNNPDNRAEATEAIRALIEKITLFRAAA